MHPEASPGPAVFGPRAGITVFSGAGVAAIEVARPHRQNAFDRAAMAAFAEAVAGLGETCARGEVRAVVLCGGGGRFLSGGDLKDLDDVRTPEGAAAFSAVMQGALAALAALPVPVIAAIDRFALGGGMEVALAADLRVAAQDAVLAFRQAPLGVTTGWGAVPRLRALVGRSTALRLLLDGPNLSAAEAANLGLVDRVAPAGTSARSAALSWAAELAARSPLAIAGLKQLVAALDPQAEALADHWQIERTLFGRTWASEAHWAAVAEHWASRDKFLNSKENQAGGAAALAQGDSAMGAPKQGRFIVLEGLDGAGTTTQSKLLSRWLRRTGRTVAETAEPSKGPLGTLLRHALNRRLVGGAGEPLDPRAVAGLFVADRADHLSAEVEPALAAGKDVVCDRYVHSSLAYQGVTTGAPQWVAAMNAPMRAADLVLFVRVSPGVASARRARRAATPDLYEVDDFQVAVAEGYERALDLRPEDPVAIIDGDADVRAVHRAICAAIVAHLGAPAAWA
jgi:dTMP kinase